MNSKDYKKIILHKLDATLKQKHFKKTGNTFTCSNGELTYFINVQSSQSSSSDILKITVNIGILSALIYKLENTLIPEKHHRHFNKRIGFYLEQPQDKWWVINDMTSANTTAIEISEIINTMVLPELDRLQTTSDLVSLWRKEQCPGLTNWQRIEYLSLLEKQIIN
jgi:hypothetical protein